mgnify:FL=1
MIDKIKNIADKCWCNHKICTIVIAVLIVAYIIK